MKIILYCRLFAYLVLWFGLGWAVFPLPLSAEESNDAGLLFDTGQKLYQQGNSKEAVPLFQEAVALYQKAGLRSNTAVARHQLAFALSSLGQFRPAIKVFAANFQYHMGLNNTETAAKYLIYQGQAFENLLDWEQTLKQYQHARILSVELRQLAEIDRNLMQIYLNHDHHAQAQDILTSAYCRDHDSLYNEIVKPLAVMYGLEPEGCQSNFLYWPLGVTATLLLFYYFRIANLLLLIGSLGAFLLLSEVVLRLVRQDKEVRHFLFPPLKQDRFYPMPGIFSGMPNKESKFSINDVGLRGDNLPTSGQTKRVVVVGGSASECLFLDDADAWPYQLQKRLKQSELVWVGNSGKSGLNSFSHLVQVHYHLQELHPDLLLVNAGINDLNQCISGGLSAITDNAKLVQSGNFFEEYRRYVFERINEKEDPIAWLQLLKKAEARIKPVARPKEGNYTVQDQAGLFYREQRRRRQVATKVDQLPEIAPCLAAFAENLRQMDAMSSGRVVFITQGMLYKEQMLPEEEATLWFGSVDQNPFNSPPPDRYYSTRVMTKLMERYNQTMLDVCRERKAICIDIANQLPRTLDTYYDDVHFNVTGATRMAEVIAKELERQEVIGCGSKK